MWYSRIQLSLQHGRWGMLAAGGPINGLCPFSKSSETGLGRNYSIEKRLENIIFSYAFYDEWQSQFGGSNKIPRRAVEFDYVLMWRVGRRDVCWNEQTSVHLKFSQKATLIEGHLLGFIQSISAVIEFFASSVIRSSYVLPSSKVPFIDTRVKSEI